MLIQNLLRYLKSSFDKFYIIFVSFYFNIVNKVETWWFSNTESSLYFKANSDIEAHSKALFFPVCSKSCPKEDNNNVNLSIVLKYYVPILFIIK